MAAKKKATKNTKMKITKKYAPIPKSKRKARKPLEMAPRKGKKRTDRSHGYTPSVITVK